MRDFRLPVALATSSQQANKVAVYKNTNITQSALATALETTAANKAITTDLAAAAATHDDKLVISERAHNVVATTALSSGAAKAAQLAMD